MVETYWGIYNYEEEKGIWSKIYDKIFHKENNYNFGLIESSQVYSLPYSPYLIMFNRTIFKALMINQMFNRLNGIHQYKGKQNQYGIPLLILLLWEQQFLILYVKLLD